MRFLPRVPRETKVAAVVLGAALVQVGVLGWLGLRGVSEQRDQLAAELRSRVEGAVRISVLNAATSRISAIEQRLQEEMERTNAPLGSRIRDALQLARLHTHAYVVYVDEDGGVRLVDHRRPPLAKPREAPRDAAAREALARLQAREASDPDGVAADAVDLADATDDPVAAALALQAGWRAALSIADDSRALELAGRVAREYATVRDDRGLIAETVPFGISAAELICEVRRRAARIDAFGEADPLVAAVIARREQAQRMRDDIGPAAYEVERAACRDVTTEFRMLLPTKDLHRLVAALDDFDALDAMQDRARRLDAAELATLVRTGEAGRLFTRDRENAIAAVVLPLDAADRTQTGAGAVAFVCTLTTLHAEALRPLDGGLELPAGVSAFVRDASGTRVWGEDGGEMLLEGRGFGPIVPGLTVGAVLSDPSVLERETESQRRLWMWILVGAGLAVVAASLLALRAVLREVRLARLKSDFVSNLSHELRTPLTSLRMFVETLQEGRVRDEAEMQEYLDVIARETERLSALVDRILTFASFSRGRAPIDLRSGNAGDVARRAAEVFSGRAKGAGARIELDVADDLPESLVDREALIQVILNVLDNAVKYGGDKGVQIRLSVCADGPRARIEVEDDGPGIPEKERELVFEEFYRGDDTLASSVQGTGIGLALSRRIVIAHGGRIAAVKGRTLGGACFRIQLPEAAVGRRIALAAQEAGSR